MKSLEILGNKNSIIENLINVNNITDISIHYHKNCFSSGYCIYGKVTFKKDNTELEQKFEGNTISNVYLQIFNFCNSL